MPKRRLSSRATKRTRKSLRKKANNTRKALKKNLRKRYHSGG